MPAGKRRPLETAPIDARLDVLAAALEPAARIALELGLSLDELEEVVAAQYFREHRKRGLTLREIAARIDKSLRTTTALSVKSGLSRLLDASERVAVERAVVELLGDGASRAQDYIETRVRAQIRGARNEDVAAVLGELARQRVVERVERKYELRKPYLNLVATDYAKRLDALRLFMRTVTDAIVRRFLRADPSADAFVRVLSFSAVRAELSGVRERAYDALRSEVLRADGAASARSRAQTAGTPASIEAAAALVVTETEPDTRSER